MGQDTMKALLYQAPHQYGLTDVPVPKIIEPTDVIGKVTLAAICTSDIHVVHGEVPSTVAPRIVGHEFCIEVVEIGSEVKNFKPGDRCVVKPSASCGECVMCKMGVRSACVRGGIFGTTVDGCFAEYMRVPFADQQGQMYKVPEGLDEESVILLPDMLATGYYGCKLAELKEGQTVAVIGVGPVGQSTCLLAKKVFGAKKVIAIDILQNRVDKALEAGVADTGINPATDDIAAMIKEATGGMGVDCTIEGAGVGQTMAMAAAITRIGGTIATISIFDELLVKIPMNEMLLKGQKLHFGIQTQEGVAEMMQLIQDGKIDARFISTHRAPLNDIMKGFEVFGKRQDGCIKWLITPYEK